MIQWRKKGKGVCEVSSDIKVSLESRSVQMEKFFERMKIWSMGGINTQWRDFALDF